MYFSRVISCSFHSRILGFPSHGVAPGAVWEADAHLGLWPMLSAHGELGHAGSSPLSFSVTRSMGR